MARDGYARKYPAPNNPFMTVRKRRHTAKPPSNSHKGKWLFAMTVLVLLSATALYSVNAHTVGPSAAHKSSAPSPANPSPLVTGPAAVVATPGNVPVGPVGSTFTIQIKAQNLPQFNGWDIRVWADTNVINATSLSITGNDFSVNASSGTPIEIVHCVNGQGTGCTSTDVAAGKGWVHSAFGDGNGVVTGSGLLFTISYQVVGNAGTSQIWFGYSPISIQNVLISSPSTGSGDPAIAMSGTYGTFQQLATGGGGTFARHD